MTSLQSYRHAIIILILTVVFNSCNEQKLTSPTTLNSTNPTTSSLQNSATVQSIFNATVGAPIDKQTGLRWMSNFTTLNTTLKLGKTVANDYYIQATTLTGILSNITCVGISLYYSLDASGNLHIIPVGVDVNGKVITMQTTTVDNIALSWQTAWQWINNYKGSVRSHFFGAQTLTQLLVNQKAKSVRLSRASDDSGNPQLLLSNAANANPTSFIDASRPCPPYCPAN